jgi:hypothetical protein
MEKKKRKKKKKQWEEGGFLKADRRVPIAAAQRLPGNSYG